MQVLQAGVGTVSQQRTAGTLTDSCLHRVVQPSVHHNAPLQTEYLLTNQPWRLFSNADGLHKLQVTGGVPGADDWVPGGVQGSQEESRSPHRLLEEVAVKQCSSRWAVAGLGLQTGYG